MSEIIKGVVSGATAGGTGLVIVAASGIPGLSAVGITSGLATAGAVIGGGMVAGLFVVAVAGAGVGAVTYKLMSRLFEPDYVPEYKPYVPQSSDPDLYNEIGIYIGHKKETASA